MLREDAMIVRLSISQWTARRVDRQVTQDVARDYQVNPEVGKYRKILIAADAIKVVSQTVNEVRQFHYDNTLPWEDGGQRILTAANFMHYSSKMRELKARFEEAVQNFLAGYGDFINEAQKRLKGLFKASDYPRRYDIGRKDNFSMDIDPIPSGDDFRISLGKKDSARIRKELETRVKEHEAAAMKDLYLRLNKVIEHFSEKLADPDAIFRDSLVENVIELVNLLPKMNLTGDPELEKLRKETQKKLCAYEPEQLRSDKDARAKAADDATALLKKMSGYVN